MKSFLVVSEGNVDNDCRIRVHSNAKSRVYRRFDSLSYNAKGESVYVEELDFAIIGRLRVCGSSEVERD